MRKNKLGLMMISFTLLLGISYFLLLFTKAEGADQSGTVYEKIAEGRNINYLIIGDSIGRGSGASDKTETWYRKWERSLKNEYGVKAKRHLIVQSGATAFEGLNKLDSTEHLGQIDVTFIVFGENDRKYMDEDQFSYFYEALIRKTKSLYPDTEIITLTENPLNNEAFAGVILKLSNHYLAKNIDLRPAFIHSGQSTFELTTDLIHPNDQGYTIYADTIFQSTIKAVANKEGIAILAPPLMDKTDITLQQTSAYTKASHLFSNDVWFSDKAGDTIEFTFSGPFLGVKVSSNEFGGMMDVFIDGKPVRTVSTWWPIEKERHLYIASGLDEGVHNVQFIVADQKSVYNVSDKAQIKLTSIIMAKNKE
ncbi:SGNH/GDSL hydrolase family protein [Cytobacillus purgationiresistens]|uniref:Lysophospholipase L1-like esterase n=1 Tax=Cytobacillus purgationiresistens TaxID=863449 RepID=A0ABU0AL43_9BACI|nr:SGNH/GDSL hydrolase family protein [Cytobacillus purgationiresistens]MDQ0271991.1 lysophospholipase L1-like esterase [Cytobacillus purgationiresistens]